MSPSCATSTIVAATSSDVSFAQAVLARARVQRLTVAERIRCMRGPGEGFVLQRRMPAGYPHGGERGTWVVVLSTVGVRRTRVAGASVANHNLGFENGESHGRPRSHGTVGARDASPTGGPTARGPNKGSTRVGEAAARAAGGRAGFAWGGRLRSAT